MKKKIGKKVMRLEIGDITDLDVEAFVYDITEDAKLGSGYGGAITSRGGKSIQDELDTIGRCPKGKAIVTAAGKLKAKKIIHVNGPKFYEPDEEKKLRSAVESALKAAEKHGIKTLAFPPIGTGLYQVDLGLCARVLVDTVAEHLARKSGLEEVVFVALDTREYQPFEAKLAKGG